MVDGSRRLVESSVKEPEPSQKGRAEPSCKAGKRAFIEP